MPKENPELQNLVTGLIGRKGSGKTRHLIELLMPLDRIFVFDSAIDHQWSPNQLESMQEVREFFSYIRKKKQWAVNYIPGEDEEPELEEISRLVFKHGDMAFVVEEVPGICSPGHLSKAFGRIVRVGRHRRIDLYWTAQRANECSRTLTSQTDIFVFFAQAEPVDIDAIQKRCGSEVADMVAHLGLHDYIVWDAVKRKVLSGYLLDTVPKL